MNGILIVNKPKEFTSHDVVAIVKKICKEKVGHTGTLDPMATGVLPLLIGQGTKLSKYLINHDKIYIATIKLGQKTDTLDCEGKIIEEKQVNLLKLEPKIVEDVLNAFIGKQKQKPPIYSAIKVNGKKLYEYARKNIQIDVPEREIEIYSMKLLNINKKEKTIEFKIHCSKGTYIRTLCESIAEKLNTVGYMKELNRIKVGEFDISQAITIEEIENNKNKEEFWNKNVISIQTFFKDKPYIVLNEKKLQLFLNGVKLLTNKSDGLYQIKANDNFIGIGIVNNKLLKRELIFT